MAPQNEKGYYIYLREELRQRAAVVMPTLSQSYLETSLKL